MKYTEFTACIAAGLDLWKWVNWEYPYMFRAEVIAWYMLHSAIESHSQDAQVDHQIREARKKRH
jgi:hypothetical protein